MSSAVAAAPLTWNEALSGVLGSASVASWVFLLVPQLLENYRQGHADGISLTFLFIWLLGDATNLAGALLARLVPTVIALAVYFCAADFLLILQCLYYLAAARRRSAEKEQDSERAPLLDAAPASEQTRPLRPRRRLTDITDENLGLPGSRRVSSPSLRRTTTTTTTATSTTAAFAAAAERRPHATALKNLGSVLAILLIGAAGWFLAWKAGAWQPTPVARHGADDHLAAPTPIAAEVLGYISAVAYLGARIPQIVKNQRERSCAGLSLLFFVLSLLGNLTYGAGILFHSLDGPYILTNLPWLIGSLGTMAEDIVIFVQFHVFGDKSEHDALV